MPIEPLSGAIFANALAACHRASVRVNQFNLHPFDLAEATGGLALQAFGQTEILLR
jgi:hypothetical protein